MQSIDNAVSQRSRGTTPSGRTQLVAVLGAEGPWPQAQQLLRGLPHGCARQQ